MRVLEVDVRNKVLVVRSWLTSGIGHGKQRYFVPLRAQEFHGLEQIDLSAAERVVIFVAE
jgi:hypothetical protein